VVLQTRYLNAAFGKLCEQLCPNVPRFRRNTSVLRPHEAGRGERRRSPPEPGRTPTQDS
jgi:hypothetical protein